MTIILHLHFDICIFNRYLYNYFDNFRNLGTLPVYGYTENKVNECPSVLPARMEEFCSHWTDFHDI